MTHSKKQLRDDLRSLGVSPGDTLLMHSSYKSLGGTEEGAAGFYEVLLDLLGERGTLIIPTLSYRDVTREAPDFDVRATPSCVGYLTEYFRTGIPDARRSLHATHSCCVRGRLREEMIRGHETDATPVGAHSPFRKLPEAGGKILFLGCSPDHNTSMHGVEETVEPMRFIDFDRELVYRIIDENGRVIERPSFRHHFGRPDGAYRQRYARVLDLLDGNEARRGQVLDADCFLLDARAVWKKGREAMLRDPYCFVEWTPLQPA